MPMEAGYWRDRRQTATSGFKLEHSVLLRIPSLIAVPLLVLVTFLLWLVDQLSPPYIWFGPAYLLIVALAAWMQSFWLAFALGVGVLTANLLTAADELYPYGDDALMLNVGLRFVSVFVVAAMLAMARRAQEQEWKLARLDPLTGALNRKAFFETVATEPVSTDWTMLVYADLDGLKQLNDGRGHELGDKALLDFADRVRRAIRKDDLFARIGGDEFVICMKVRSELAAASVARRLNQSLNIEMPEDCSTLRCSLGMLILPPGARSIDDELRAVDQLMYEAKKTRAGMSMAIATERDGTVTISRLLESVAPHDREAIVRSGGRTDGIQTGEESDVVRVNSL